MNLYDFKKMLPCGMQVDLSIVPDDDILKEVDIRGFHMGVSYQDLTLLTTATVQQDWAAVSKIVGKLARDNLGRII